MRKKSTHAEIPIADIVVDAHTQARSAMSEEAIDKYTDVLENEPSGEWPFEHLDVFFDDAAGPNGGRYVLADGFHRLEAAKRNGNWDTVPCSVHSGNHIAARLFSITANDGHGVPMTRKDKRDNFVWLQQHFPELTREEQAIKLGVSERTLHRIVASLREPATPENVVTTTSSGNAKKAANKKPERDKYCHVADRSDDTADDAAEAEDVEATAERAAEPAADVYDALQRCVPAQHREAQSQAMRLIGIGRTVDAIRGTVESLLDAPGGAWLNMQQIDTAVRELKRLITKAAYYTHCDVCKGTGRKGSGACKTCDGHGWIPEWMREQQN